MGKDAAVAALIVEFWRWSCVKARLMDSNAVTGGCPEIGCEERELEIAALGFLDDVVEVHGSADFLLRRGHDAPASLMSKYFAPQLWTLYIAAGSPRISQGRWPSVELLIFVHQTSAL